MPYLNTFPKKKEDGKFFCFTLPLEAALPRFGALRFGKGKRITGNELIGFANDIMADIQHRIGGGIIYLDCEDKEHLKNFYIIQNHYKIFGERYSHTENVRYLQMIRFF